MGHQIRLCSSLKSAARYVNQSHGGGLCPSASVLYTIAKTDVVAYARLVTDLYENGQAQLKSWRLTPRAKLLKVFTSMTYPYHCRIIETNDRLLERAYRIIVMTASIAIAVRYTDAGGRSFILGEMISRDCARIDATVVFPITNAIEHAIHEVKPIRIHFIIGPNTTPEPRPWEYGLYDPNLQKKNRAGSPA
jgi:hypothetical protein